MITVKLLDCQEFNPGSLLLPPPAGLSYSSEIMNSKEPSAKKKSKPPSKRTPYNFAEPAFP